MRELSTDLLAWYDQHAREMPWRVGPAARKAGQLPDPYAVWLSEVMLQQTTVAAVRAYHQKFMGLWPTVADLAAAAQMFKGCVPVNLVTGLPIGYYRQYKDELAKLLVGEHKVTLVDGNGKKEEKSISINKVRVVPQPFGSLFNMMLNDLGEMGDKRLIKDKIGIIDVGFRTSDYTISDKMRYSERGSRTTDSGIARAFNVIATKLRENSGINVELYRLYEAIDEGSIKIRGKVYDLKSLTDQVFSQLATSIANEVDRLWVDDWDIDAMVVTGGGGAVLAKYLKPLLNGEIMETDPDLDMRLYNVHGYRKFGQHLWALGNTPPQAPAAPTT